VTRKGFLQFYEINFDHEKYRHTNKASYLSSLYRAAAAVVLIWTASIGGFLFWDVHVAKEHAEELARQEVRVRFNKDMAFRSWVTSHGGVYVPVDEHTQPNPYLNVPERDIETLSGKKKTDSDESGLCDAPGDGRFCRAVWGPGHLTSLKLLNPVNVPDEWERSALLRFERGSARSPSSPKLMVNRICARWARLWWNRVA